MPDKVAGPDESAHELRLALYEADTLAGHNDAFTEWREKWAHLWAIRS